MTSALTSVRKHGVGEMDVVATPPKSAPPKRAHFASPNLKQRSQKVLDMLRLHNEAPDEFQFQFRAKRTDYVMAEEIDFEELGLKYEQEERGLARMHATM
jgi:hypothetical protein